MLRESQNFFFDLMSKPSVVAAFKKNRGLVLKKYFRDEKDRKALAALPFERFETYRKHVSVGLLGGIENAFPVLRSLVSDPEWRTLLDGFYAAGMVRSPIARHIYREFAQYLRKYRGPLLARFPYLRELAEYENLELALFYDVDRDAEAPAVRELASVKDPAAVLRLVPILNPHHALRVYRWPVHRICREFSARGRVKPGRFGLLVYRDPVSLQVRFLETNPLTAELVRELERGRTIESLLRGLIRENKPSDVQTFVAEAMGVLSFLAGRGVILGYGRP